MVYVENVKSISIELTSTLKKIFKENMFATKAIKFTLKVNNDWNDEKRGCFSDTIYDITRYWRLLWYLAKKEPSFNQKDLLEIVEIYLFYKKIVPGNEDLVNRLNKAQKIRALRESIPDWLDRLGQREIGKNWNDVLKVLNKKPELIIRVNTLKKTKEELLDVFKNEKIIAEKINLVPDALLISKTNIFKLKSFQEGFFEVQDIASQMVSIFLEPKPGMLVVDACAGEGSKTLHIAALMKNRGRIIAMDLQDWRLKQLRKRAKRAGAYNIETRQITSSKSYKRLKFKVDRLLLDVPCSGLGTLRRNPDIKWKISFSDLERLKKIQAQLLEKYCCLLKQNGRLVYSVCSILPSEGDDQIKSFIEKQDKKFELVKEKRLSPDKDNTDGFYMALI
ncbi:MAG: RsmB/NOP family class I SAM-dependent RNA methyltransferase, partial [Candidatus Thermoplasmatota archaeon]|nr:RsmB/NOP family class I SAM-dependent RNA methyltransferase [Candidatus Thermoplasmatota archaeon]